MINGSALPRAQTDYWASLVDGWPDCGVVCTADVVAEDHQEDDRQAWEEERDGGHEARHVQAYARESESR